MRITLAHSLIGASASITFVPALHVRDVPEPVIAALKARARRRGVSMQHELRLVLQEAADAVSGPDPVGPLDLVTASSNGASSWSREDMYGDDGR